MDMQEEQQPSAYQAVPVFKQDKADLLDKIRPDVVVETMRHKLMGEDFIDGKWIKNNLLDAKALTPLGAWEISNLMLGVSSQNVSLSNLKEKDIKNRTLSIVNTALDMCLKNWKSYGIKGADQFSFIYEIVISNTFITLKQPENNGIRRLLQGTTQEVRSFSNVRQEPSSFLSGLFRARQR